LILEVGNACWQILHLEGLCGSIRPGCVLISVL
jgi:hypothetical protein